MTEAITGALSSFGDELNSTAATAMSIGAVALLAWLGWRLACKIPNRAVGK